MTPKYNHAAIAAELRRRFAANPDLLWTDVCVGLCSRAQAQKIAREFKIEQPKSARKQGTKTAAQIMFTGEDPSRPQAPEPPPPPDPEPDEPPPNYSIIQLTKALCERAEEMRCLAPKVARRVVYGPKPMCKTLEYVDPDAISMCLRIAHRWLGYAINYSLGGTPKPN